MAEQPRSSLAQTSFSPLQVRAVVNRFLLSQVGSVFAAGTPELDSVAHLWYVPILYHPPDFTGDEVGQGQVSAITGEIQQHTPAAELRERAVKLHGRDKNSDPHRLFTRKKKIARTYQPVCAWYWRRMG